MTRHTEIVFGPPGTGKTEYLLRLAEHYLVNKKLAPERLAFLSFSKRAVHEAVTRMCEIMPGTTADSFPYFRTIHSLGFHLKAFRAGHVMGHEELQMFGKQYHYEFNGFLPEDKVNWGGTPEDRALATYLVNRARCGTSLFQQWCNTGGVRWSLIERLVPEYERFKEANDLVDFADMIDLQHPYGPAFLDADVMIVDEAQDTSQAQWRFLRHVARNVHFIHLAGDDDQTIYEWNGADAAQLLGFLGAHTSLPHSHRLPRAIKTLADRIASRIRIREPKVYTARDADGRVEALRGFGYVPLTSGTWLLLARTNKQLQAFREWARREGVVYTLANGSWSWTEECVQAAILYERLRRGQPLTFRQARTVLRFLPYTRELEHKEKLGWDDVLPAGADHEWTWMAALTRMGPADREYVRMLRANKESLHEPGRVRIGTVHNMKGAQADNVVLYTETGQRIHEEAKRNPDAETRVQYVACTRARENLYLLDGQGLYYWRF
jgi:DNA helicase II / ATP-dependent DNA helicase PcrA